MVLASADRHVKSVKVCLNLAGILDRKHGIGRSCGHVSLGPSVACVLLELADQLDLISVRVVNVYGTAGEYGVGAAAWFIAGGAERLLLGVEEVGRQLEGQVVELMAGRLAGDLGRHGDDHDHLGNPGGTFAGLEKDVGKLGRRDHFEAEKGFVECDGLLLVPGPEDDFGDTGDH